MSFIYKTECQTLNDTIELANFMASVTKKGDTYALFGTLGVGKSVFARAFIQKLTNAKEVPSPTFTLLQTYENPDFEIYHYDLYRLKSTEEIFELNIEEALFGAVTLIEWPEKMGAYLPRDVFKIFISANENGTRIFQIETISEEKRNRLRNIPMIREI